MYGGRDKKASIVWSSGIARGNLVVRNPDSSGIIRDPL